MNCLEYERLIRLECQDFLQPASMMACIRTSRTSWAERPLPPQKHLYIVDNNRITHLYARFFQARIRSRSTSGIFLSDTLWYVTIYLDRRNTRNGNRNGWCNPCSSAPISTIAGGRLLQR